MQIFFRKLRNAVRGQDFNPLHVLHCLFFWEPKTVTAMMRIKDEEEFLEASVLSIVDHVEEVVIVDNNSTDRTPEIIAKLQQQYPEKVHAYVYAEDIQRAGKANEDEYTRDPHSPRLLSSYYNWCLDKCTQAYIMKWDGDMIATDAFGSLLKKFKKSALQTLNFTGENIWSDYAHFCKRHPYDEPRVFRRKYATYVNNPFCELLKSPVLFLRYKAFQSCYLHMKMCKADPASNISKENLDGRLEFQKGEPLTAEAQSVLSQYGLIQ